MRTTPLAGPIRERMLPIIRPSPGPPHASSTYPMPFIGVSCPVADPCNACPPWRSPQRRHRGEGPRRTAGKRRRVTNTIAEVQGAGRRLAAGRPDRHGRGRDHGRPPHGRLRGHLHPDRGPAARRDLTPGASDGIFVFLGSRPPTASSSATREGRRRHGSLVSERSCGGHADHRIRDWASSSSGRRGVPRRPRCRRPSSAARARRSRACWSTRPARTSCLEPQPAELR